MTQQELSEHLGVKRSMISAYEDGRSDPKLPGLVALSELFHVSLDALLAKDMTSGEGYQANSSLKILAVTVDRNDEEGICLVAEKASAGYLNGYADEEFVSNLPQFNLPHLPKNRTYRAFEISGDSMLPISPGTIVIGAYLASLQEIKSAKTYLLVTRDEGIVYKRVFNYLDENGKLFLVSDNPIYKPYEIHPSEVIEVWEAKAFISTEFPGPPAKSEEVSLSELADMIRDLREEIRKAK